MIGYARTQKLHKPQYQSEHSIVSDLACCSPASADWTGGEDEVSTLDFWESAFVSHVLALGHEDLT